ncbi:MAG: 6-phosphofructokinase [Ruminococcaceae bacterium]|nr:6-phosphofructokinase [Oscillospiraceae bacterium]
MKYNAIVGQSGGPTAAINATLSGVIRGCRESGKVETLYGMYNGIEGALKENFCSLFDVIDSEEKHRLLEGTPSSALGSCRKKLPKTDDPEAKATYEKLFNVFEKYNIKYFFYIGGNDSMDTVAKISAYAKENNKEIFAIGVPKTIDNDLMGTDHTPGFGSAAKYIAATVAETARDSAVYDLKSVVIFEIMGRDAGWLTASAALPSLNSSAAPDFIYLPERAFDEDKFIADIKSKLEVKNTVLVAVSEGIKNADGKYISASERSEMKDAFGHAYLSGTGKALEMVVRDKIGCKVRSIELNVLQRCASHIASETDINESVAIGRFAGLKCTEGESGKLAVFVRSDSEEYSVTYDLKDVALIANKIKKVPDEYINDEGNNVTKACLEYILPLIMGENKIEYVNGIPAQIEIKPYK